MKRIILFALAIAVFPLAVQSQAADVEAIKTNIEQMRKDMSQGIADPDKFDQNHNLKAYSSGGLWGGSASKLTCENSSWRRTYIFRQSTSRQGNLTW